MNPLHHANRAAAVRFLAALLESEGLFVTPADLGPLASEVLTDYADGSTAVTCSPEELLRRAEGWFPALRERAECTVPWCAGERAQHATFDPDEAEHTSASEHLTLGGEMVGWLAQTGSTPPRYALATSDSPLLTAPELRALAAVLLDRAAELEAAEPEGVAL